MYSLRQYNIVTSLSSRLEALMLYGSMALLSCIIINLFNYVHNLFALFCPVVPAWRL